MFGIFNEWNDLSLIFFEQYLFAFSRPYNNVPFEDLSVLARFTLYVCLCYQINILIGYSHTKSASNGQVEQFKLPAIAIAMVRTAPEPAATVVGSPRQQRDCAVSSEKCVV